MMGFAKIIWFLLLVICSNAVFAQNQAVIDSLLQVVKTDISDKEKVDTYVLLAKKYSASDSVNTAKYVNKAILLAKKINYPEGQIVALYQIGRVTMIKKDYTKAEEIFNRIIKHSELINFLKIRSDAIRGIGKIKVKQDNVPKALEYFFNALEIREVMGDKRKIASSYNDIGITYHRQGNYTQALVYYFKCLEITKEIGGKSKMVFIYHSIGTIYKKQGNNSKALDYYFMCLEIAQEMGDKQMMLDNLKSIGSIHTKRGNNSKALDYYLKSLEIAKEIGDKRRIARSYNSIGNVYLTQGNYPQAFDYHLKSLNIKEEIGYKRGIGTSYYNIGLIYQAQGDYPQALAYYFKSLKIKEEIGDNATKAYPLNGIGTTYLKQQKLSEAKKYLFEGLSIGQETGLVQMIMETTEQLAIVEKELGNYQAAYQNHVLFKAMADSLQNQEVTEKMTRLEAEYEFQQEKDSIEFANANQQITLEKDIEKRKLNQLGTLIVLGLVLALAIILYLFFRAKSRSNKLLTEKSAEQTKSNQALIKSNLEVKQQAESILTLNRLLEKDLDETSKDLLAKNQKLAEYAFYNSHKTRAPLASMLGLIDLLNPKLVDKETARILELVLECAKNLDQVVTEINDILSDVDFYEDIKQKATRTKKGSNEL